MGRRLGFAAAIALVAVVGLTGCQANASPSISRGVAQQYAATWTRQVVAAVKAPASKATTKVQDFQACRTDHGFITTVYQWRTITDVDVPLARQAAAMRAIRAAFESNNWSGSQAHGLLTMVGPNGEKEKGAITVQTAGPSALSVGVISPCYQ